MTRVLREAAYLAGIAVFCALCVWMAASRAVWFA